MTANAGSNIRRIYGVLLSVSILIAGICLMAACAGIYFTEGLDFSREAVAAAFQPIRVPVYLCLFLVLAGFPLNWRLPGEGKKRRSGTDDAILLQRLHNKTDLNACSEELRNAVAAQQKSRNLHRAIRTGLLACSGLVFLIYIFTGDRFQMPDINGSMIHAMRILLPCLSITFAYAIFTAYRNRASVRKEIALMKQAGTEAVKKDAPQSKCQGSHSAEKRCRAVRCAVLAAALILLIYGFCTGGTSDVLTKAINICTECVGLG